MDGALGECTLECPSPYPSSLNRWRGALNTTGGKDSTPSQNQGDTSTNENESSDIVGGKSAPSSDFPRGHEHRRDAYQEDLSVNLQTKDDCVEQSSRQPDLEQHTNARLAMSEVPSRPWSESTNDEEMSQSNTRPKEEVWYDAQQSHD